MKWTYKTQLIITFVAVIMANIITDIFSFWLYRSLGFVLCGLMWIIHPVLPQGAVVSKGTVLSVRLAGLFLILIGIFTRVHY